MNFQEGKTQTGIRKKPLLKSMMLPESPLHSKSPTTRPAHMANLDISPLRKPTQTTAISDIQEEPPSPHGINFSHNPHYQPHGTPNTVKSPHILQKNQNNHSYILKGLVSPNKIETQSQVQPEDKPRKGSKLVTGQQIESIATQIMDQIREQHIPALVIKIKKEFYEEIHQLRHQFQTFKEETRNQFKKHEKSINEMLYTTPPSPGKTGKEKPTLAQLQKFYLLLESKLAAVESRNGQNRKFIEGELNRMNACLSDQLKSKYVKMQEGGVVGLCGHRSLGQRWSIERWQLFRGKRECQWLVVVMEVYHLDREGYLLDSSGYYLIDQHSAKIRLGQRHLKLLASHGLLPKPS